MGGAGVGPDLFLNILNILNMKEKMQFLCCKVHFSNDLRDMWPTFGELAGFNIEIFGF